MWVLSNTLSKWQQNIHYFLFCVLDLHRYVQYQHICSFSRCQKKSFHFPLGTFCITSCSQNAVDIYSPAYPLLHFQLCEYIYKQKLVCVKSLDQIVRVNCVKASDLLRSKYLTLSSTTVH